MANIYKRWLCEESLKTPSSRPILIYFEFRSKPSLITVICMDPHSPNKLFATKYCFLILVDETSLDDTSFFFFISFFFFFVIINFYKNHFIIIIFLFFFSCSWIFRNVPACSGMFRVPGFIDARTTKCVCNIVFRFVLLVEHAVSGR